MTDKIPSFDCKSGWRISSDGNYLYFGDMPPDNYIQEVFLSEYFLKDGRYYDDYRDKTLGWPHGWAFKIEDIVSKLQTITPQGSFPQVVDFVSQEFIEPNRRGFTEEKFSLKLESFEKVKLFLTFFAA